MTTSNSPETNRWWVTIVVAILVLIAVIVAWRQLSLNQQSQAEVARHQVFDRSMDGLFRRNSAYREALNRAADEVAAGRLSLRHAVERMTLTEQWNDPLWRRRVSEQFPGQTERASLASSIAYHALRSTSGSPSEAAQLAQRLRPQMRALGATVEMATAGVETEPAQPMGGPVGVNMK